MKFIFGMLLLFGGLAVAYGGTFATFWYGVYLMVKDGFLFGLFVSTIGAALVFFIGIMSAAAGKVMAED